MLLPHNVTVLTPPVPMPSHPVDIKQEYQYLPVVSPNDAPSRNLGIQNKPNLSAPSYAASLIINVSKRNTSLKMMQQ